MASDPEQLMQQAQKAVGAASSGGFGWFSSSSKEEKLEKAAMLYQDAAMAYTKMNKHRQAGQALEKAGETIKNYPQVSLIPSQLYISAADAYVKATEKGLGLRETRLPTFAEQEPKSSSNLTEEDMKNLRDAVRCREIVLKGYEADHKDASMRAKITESIADIYAKLGDLKVAEEMFTQAGSGSMPATAHKIFEKAAVLFVNAGDYEAAMRMYEAAVVKAMPSPTLSWSLRNHLFMLSLCHLAVGDNVATNRALEQYRGIDSGFANGQEYSLAANLLEAVSAGDKEMFEQIEASYLRTARQDPVRDKLLLLIKNAIQAQPDDDFS